MERDRIYHHSPLTPQSVTEAHGRSLLLQFIVYELFIAQAQSKKEETSDWLTAPERSFFPYNWSHACGCLTKIDEHATLLPVAFPKLSVAVDAFGNTLSSVKERATKQPIPPLLKELYLALDPFFLACKESETLLLFLIQHAGEIEELAAPETLSSTLRKLYPDDLSPVSHIIRREYKARGFDTLLSQIDELLSQYEE